MIHSLSHVGLAIFNPPGYPTQWVLVLSADELFQGRVLCGTIGMTVNGWQEIWTTCDDSPASFNRAARFAGVIHVARLTVPVERVHSEIRSKGLISKKSDPTYTDQYVLQALGSISNRNFCFGPSSICNEKELNKAIQARVPLLYQYSRVDSSFPIVSLC
jgi:hypothetical protein